MVPFRKIVAHRLFRILKMNMWTVRISKLNMWTVRSLEIAMWTVRFVKMERWSFRVFRNKEMLHEGGKDEERGGGVRVWGMYV